MVFIIIVSNIESMFLLEFILSPGLICSSIIDPIWNRIYSLFSIFQKCRGESGCIALNYVTNCYISTSRHRDEFPKLDFDLNDEFKCQDYVLIMLRHKTLKESKKMTPQNVPLWHIDCCELNLLKKQLVQEGHPGPLLFPGKQKINLPREGTLPISWV